MPQAAFRRGAKIKFPHSCCRSTSWHYSLFELCCSQTIWKIVIHQRILTRGWVWPLLWIVNRKIKDAWREIYFFITTMSCRSQGNIKTCNIYGNMKNKRNILVIILILSFLMPFYSKDQEIPTKYLPGSRMPSSYSVVKHEKKPDNINFLGLPDD